VLPDFLPEWLCDYVIQRAAPALDRGRIVNDTGGESVSEVRSNRVMNFGLADGDLLLELINLRAAAAAGMPPEHGEGLGVLHYRPGESYAPHVDFIPDTPANAVQLAMRGQRTRTLLVYLNDGFEEGETEFPVLGRRFRPPKGSALVFHSVDASGQVDRRTVHAGRSPVNGDKWVISKWFRTKPLRPGPPA
jgi:prolyl 4-hydroxylase